MSLSLKTALNATGWNGLLLTHVMGWFGDSHYHPMTRYRSNDPYTIHKQLDVMQAVGIDGVILTWQGVTVNPLLHQTACEMSFQCAERGMKFILLLDPWISKGSTNLEQPIIDSLNDSSTQHILNSPSYVPEKYVLDFGTGANFSTISKTLPNLQFLMRHTGYSWPEITNTLQTLTADNANPAMKIPGLCLKFFDGGLPNAQGVIDYNTQTWGSGVARSIEDQAGNFFHDQVAVTPKAAPYAAIVTWNDFNERTGVEAFCSMITGIRIN